MHAGGLCVVSLFGMRSGSGSGLCRVLCLCLCLRLCLCLCVAIAEHPSARPVKRSILNQRQSIERYPQISASNSASAPDPEIALGNQFIPYSITGMVWRRTGFVSRTSSAQCAAPLSTSTAGSEGTGVMGRWDASTGVIGHVRCQIADIFTCARQMSTRALPM